MPWKPQNDFDYNFGPTLGWYAIDWIEAMFSKPGAGDYQPYELYEEMKTFLLNFYAIDHKRERQKYNRGVLSRPRGWGKSPNVGVMLMLEALGEIVFDGWDADGQPVGRTWASVTLPNISLAAVSQDQTDNTWDPLKDMLEVSPIMEYYDGIIPQATEILLPRGKVQKITASASSAKGKGSVFCAMDQALALDTLIPTPTGFTTMGELKVGDQVIGSEGQPVNVTEAKPVSVDHDTYLVTTEDGQQVVASAGHLWHSKKMNWPKKYEKVRTTEEMISDKYNYSIPAAKPRFGVEVGHPVHPYILGAWLGDGHHNQASITASAEDVEEMAALLIEAGADVHHKLGFRSEPNGYGGGATHRISLSSNKEQSEVSKGLRSLPSWGNKHIPGEYLNGSIEQRLALVQGLMDTDGSASKQGLATFCTTSDALLSGMKQLLQSLGQVPSLRVIESDRYTSGHAYQLRWEPKHGLNPFRLKRKADRISGVWTRRGDWVKIVSIEKVDRVPVRCIAVDSEDHLFAYGEAGHFTHNTESWVPSNGGKKLYNVLSSNVAKMGGRYIETPNAFYHGEESVAEGSYTYWRMAEEGRLRAPRLYYDHREAASDHDIEDYDQLIEALRESYGDASGDPRGCAIHMPPCEPGHKDIEILADTIMDPNKEEADTRADFLNQVVSAADAWLQHDEIYRVVDGHREISLDEPIVLGFDGSRGRVRGKADATALVGLSLADGHFFQLGLWEEGGTTGSSRIDSKWAAPVAEIDARVEEVHNIYNVVGFFGDPSGWEVNMAQWEAKYGYRYQVKATASKPIMIFPRGKTASIHEHVVQLRSAIINRECTLDGSAGMMRHLENARRRNKKGGYLLYKETPQSTNKIDMAYAMVMAWMARVAAIRLGLEESDGVPVSRKVRVYQ